MEDKIIEAVISSVEQSNHLFNKEEDFRIAVYNSLKLKFKNRCLIIPEYTYNGKSIDLLMSVDNEKYMIELKYRTNGIKDYKAIVNNQTINYEIKKQKLFYEYMMDVERIGNMFDDPNIQKAYAIMLTNIEEFNCKKVKEYPNKVAQKVDKKIITIKTKQKIKDECTEYSVKSNKFCKYGNFRLVITKS